MDGSIKPGLRGTEEIVTTAMANLAERTEELRQAMSAFGVRPGHPESVLLYAMTSSQPVSYTHLTLSTIYSV